MKPFKCALKKVSRGPFKCAQTKTICRKTFQRSTSKVPKQKKKVQKKFQSSPSSVPKQKKMRVKKRFKSCFIPYFKVWSSVSRFHPLYGDFRDIWKPRMKQRKGMRQGMGRGSTFQITLLQWNIFVFCFSGLFRGFQVQLGPQTYGLKIKLS
jgi:hypothetical protein